MMTRKCCLFALVVSARVFAAPHVRGKKQEEPATTTPDYSPSNVVRVTREMFLNESAIALWKAREVWESVDTECVMTIVSGEPAEVAFGGGESSSGAPRLCLVKIIADEEHSVDDEKVAIMTLVDSVTYLEKPGNWEAFVNKAVYSTRTRRRFYVWIGKLPQELLDARPGSSLPWMRCAESPGNTLNVYKAIAFLALLRKTRPRVQSALYMDADAWFSDATGVSPESYAALSPRAELMGNQNRVGSPKIVMNGGLLLAKNTPWTSRFFATWWHSRCGMHDQLPLWSTIMASVAADTPAHNFVNKALFATYKKAHTAAIDALRKSAGKIRAAHLSNNNPDFDGGSYAETGLLTKPLELPRILLLPSAPIIKAGVNLPAFRSDFDADGPTFLCHTKPGSVENGRQCVGDDVCKAGKCSPLITAGKKRGFFGVTPTMTPESSCFYNYLNINLGSIPVPRLSAITF